MTNSDVWMKREAERQQMLGGLQMSIYRKEDGEAGRLSFDLDLMKAMLQWLTNLKGSERKTLEETPGSTFLRDEIGPTIAEFARTKEEADALFANLFVWLAESVANQIRIPLQRQEVCEPGKVYGANLTDS